MRKPGFLLALLLVVIESLSKAFLEEIDVVVLGLSYNYLLPFLKLNYNQLMKTSQVLLLVLVIGIASDLVPRLLFPQAQPTRPSS